MQPDYLCWSASRSYLLNSNPTGLSQDSQGWFNLLGRAQPLPVVAVHVTYRLTLGYITLFDLLGQLVGRMDPRTQLTGVYLAGVLL